MNESNKYSDKELALIKKMGMLDIIQSTSMTSRVLYQMMCKQAFVYGARTEVASSLRRCMKVLDDTFSGPKCYRLTEEFDNLIQLEPIRDEKAFLEELASGDSCEGNCDEEPPYAKCPGCASREALNEAGEITREAYFEIKKQVEKNIDG